MNALNIEFIVITEGWLSVMIAMQQRSSYCHANLGGFPVYIHAFSDINTIITCNFKHTEILTIQFYKSLIFCNRINEK